MDTDLPAIRPAMLYEHPDGMGIYFEPFTPGLYCLDADDAVTINIGPLGMIALGHELIVLGESLRKEGVE